VTSRRPLGHLLAWWYAAALAVAAIYVATQFVRAPGTSELAGMVFVVLGLPWTIAVPFLMGLGPSAWMALLGVAAGCALNFWLLRRVGSPR
jgi:hypothetical protein